MRSELIVAINQICSEKSLQRDVVIEAIESALVKAYKGNFNATGSITVKLDQDTGQIRVFSTRTVVEKISDSKNEILLPQAKAIDPRAELGGVVYIETTPNNFGRIAAQTARQAIVQSIREAERNATFKAFADRENEIVSGVIQRIEHSTGDVTVMLDRGEAVLPKLEQISGERYRPNARVRAYLVEVQKNPRGPVLKLSRTHRNMLRRLLELEVPEIANGLVEIKSIAREPGQRSKVAVAAVQFGVDPVGSCVGMRGVRIQNIVTELNGEKIDVVEWSADPRTFIINALSPAKVNEVYLDDRGGDNKTAIVVVPDKQQSLAIGKEGQNARLAAKLTGWRIDIKSETEAARDNLSQQLVMKAHQQATPSELDFIKRAEQFLRQGTTGTFDTLAVERRTFDPEPPATQVSRPAVAPAAPIPVEPAPVEPPVVETPAAAAPEPAAAVLDTAAVAPEPATTAPTAAAAPAAVEEEAAVQPEIEIPADYLENELEGTESVEDIEAERERKRKRDKKKVLVFDERRGEVMSVRRHKRGRADWALEDEE